MSSDAPAPVETRKPWSLAWIAAAIVAFAAFYTTIRLNYARPDKALEPYQASQDAALGPLAGPTPWVPVAVTTTAAVPGETSTAQLNYLPMATGVPREFGSLLPSDAVWPAVVEGMSVSRAEGLVTVRLTLAWPEKVTVPGGWFGFARAALTAESAGSSKRLLSQLRNELERSIFFTDHVLLLPDPKSAPDPRGSDARSLVLTFPEAALPAKAPRLIVPTRRGLAFVELPAVP